MDYSSVLSHQSSWHGDDLSLDRSKAVDELLRGREVTNQLRYLLGECKPAASGTVPAEDLVARILKSFASTLSMLDSSKSGEVSQAPVAPVSDDSGGDSCKSTLTLKERRARYKKRKMDNTYTRVTVDLVDDGYAWRKYGQKDIHRSPFPRNYFRCTHKFDQPGCQATKQVQQISQNPPMFRTTYGYHHTCTNFLQPPQIIFYPSPSDSSRMLCFQTNPIADGQDHKNDKPFSSSWFASSAASTVEPECKKEIGPDYYMADLADQLLPPDQNAIHSCNIISPESLFEDVCDFNSVVDGANYYQYPY